MSEAPLPPIETSIEIASPPSEVWAAMIDPASVAAWLGCLNFTPEIGTTFHMQPDPAKRASGDIGGATCCDVEQLEPGRCLEFSWYLPGTPKTMVRIELMSSAPNRTIVSLIHSGWDQFPAAMIAPIRTGLEGGWGGHVLPALKTLCESPAA
jgi:uncharacterized protein YndB with AHSA1/START domain